MDEQITRLSLGFSPSTVSNTRSNNDLWAQAVERLSAEDKANINFSYDKLETLSSLNADAKAAQKKCEDNRSHFKRRSGEKVILRDLFGKVVKWIDLFKQVRDTAVQYDPGHAALPWALIRFLLQATVNDIEKYEFVAESIEVVSRCLCRCRILEQLYVDGTAAAAEQLESALIRLYSAILLFLSKLKSYFNQSKAARLMSSTFRDKSEFQAFLNDIIRGQDDINQCAALICREDECSRYQDLKQALEEFNKPLQRIYIQLQNIQDNLQDSKRERILNWMSNIEKIPYLKHHKENKRQMLSGTGHWLLEDRTFKNWKDDSASSLLWLHGIPGSGKSKLTSLVIEDTLKCAAQDQIPRPAYFYCSRNSAEPLRSDSNAILGSIARQLASLNPTSPLLPPVVEKYAEEEGQGATSTSLDVQDSSELISGLLDLYPTAFIIIDALDECTGEARIDLLDFIKATLETSACLVKFFISSREDEEIVYQLNKFPNVEISSTKNQADIEAFVESETTNLVKRGTLLRNSQRKQALEKEIRQKVSTDAGGMFRWASMQLQHLTTLKTDEDISHHLGKIPPSLEALYQDIYERITTNRGSISKVVARNTFSLLLRLKENLLPSEFVKLVQDEDQGSSAAMPSNTILDICCNLVVLDKTLDVFRFAHLSVREFFEKLPEFYLEGTHSAVAICCMKHIDTAERSKPYEWWNPWGPKPDKMIGDYIDLWLLHHLHSTGYHERIQAQLLKHTARLLSRADFYSLFLRPAIDRTLPVPRTINLNLAFLFNACAAGFSEIAKASMFHMQRSGSLPWNVQLSTESKIHQDLESLKRTGELCLSEFTQDLAPDVVTLLAKHAISHGSFVVLHFLLHENLCIVTEAMLLLAVNAYDTRKTSGFEWREPAVIVDLLLHNAARQSLSGLLNPYPTVTFDEEIFPQPTGVSGETARSLKHLLTPAVIEKAVGTIRLASTRGIQVLVTHVLIKWGANILLTSSLRDSILQWSSNPTETVLLFLDSHDDLSISWDFLKPIVIGPGKWFQNDLDCLRCIRKCVPDDITSMVLEQVTAELGAFHPIPNALMQLTPRLVINESLLIAVACSNSGILYLLEKLHSKDDQKKLLTHDVLMAAMAASNSGIVYLLDRFHSKDDQKKLLTQDMLMAFARASPESHDIIYVLENGVESLEVTAEVLMTLVGNPVLRPLELMKALYHMKQREGFRVTEEVISRLAFQDNSLYPEPRSGDGKEHRLDILLWLIQNCIDIQTDLAKKIVVKLIEVDTVGEDQNMILQLLQALKDKTRFYFTSQMLEGYYRTRMGSERLLLDWFLDNLTYSRDAQQMMDRMVLTRDSQWASAMALRKWTARKIT